MLISGKGHRSSISAEHKRPRRTDVCHICVSVDTMSHGSVPWDPSHTSTGSCGWSDEKDGAGTTEIIN